MAKQGHRMERLENLEYVQQPILGFEGCQSRILMKKIEV